MPVSGRCSGIMPSGEGAAVSGPKTITELTPDERAAKRAAIMASLALAKQQQEEAKLRPVSFTDLFKPAPESEAPTRKSTARRTAKTKASRMQEDFGAKAFIKP